MDPKEKQAIFNDADLFAEYLKDNDAELTSLLKKLTELEGISDKQMSAIMSMPAGRGTQHYLIEYLNSNISIQTQKQSILKDKRDIRNNALNLALKNMKGEDIGDAADVLTKLQILVNTRKQEAADAVGKIEEGIAKAKTDAELDAEIEKKLAER
jgi:hypothetical protein